MDEFSKKEYNHPHPGGNQDPPSQQTNLVAFDLGHCCQNKLLVGESTLRNILLFVEYDGTHFSGWQVQPNQRTVQGELERILQRTVQEPELRIMGSGRTDAGVHALGMGTSFKTEHNIPLEGLVRGLNSQLPEDIAVLSAREVPPAFCARRWARGKLYRYRIYNLHRRSSLERLRTWHVRAPLDLEAMRQGAKYLIGRHDFSSFRASGCASKHASRDIWNIRVYREGPQVIIDVSGSAFLRQMVRNIVGCLVAVGTGERTPEYVGEFLRQRSRHKGPQTAPAQGLYLIYVNYELPPIEDATTLF